MVLCLLLTANVEEDYQPKGFASGWPAQDPRGSRALETSLYQMKGAVLHSPLLLSLSLSLSPFLSPFLCQ